MNVLIPLIDKVKYVHSLKEITVDIPQQTAVCSDNVTINIDGVMFLHITDPFSKKGVRLKLNQPKNC